MSVEDRNANVGDKEQSKTKQGLLFTLKAFWISSRTIFAIIFICTIYLLPTGVAMIRGRENTVAIFGLNFFLGWIIIGWVVALVWALKSPEKTTIIIQQNSQK